MATFYPPYPADVVTLTCTLDHHGRQLTVTLPYTTEDQREIRAIRREFSPRETPPPS